jgi:DNA-binding NtrC family response regulator
MPPARIMVVDDEPALLKLMQAYLTRLHYSVRAFPQATEAWQAFQAMPNDVDLLIVDLTLPDMSGEQLGTQMVRANRGVKVLVVSGYPFEIASLPQDVQVHFASVQKPFVPQTLANEVKQLLNRTL